MASSSIISGRVEGGGGLYISERVHSCSYIPLHGLCVCVCACCACLLVTVLYYTIL